MPQLPSIPISDPLFVQFEEWRSRQHPIPSKAKAIRYFLKKGLKQELAKK